MLESTTPRDRRQGDDAARSRRALCVDLDGTLIDADLLWECLFSMARTRPWVLAAVPIWLLRGRAYLKRRLAAGASIEFATLPYRQDVLNLLESAHRGGRPVVLATASDEALAHGVSRHLGLFSRVMASDGVTNLKGPVKAESLVRLFGSGNFDYIGDSRADIPCWAHAADAMTTNDSLVGRVPNLRSVRSSTRTQVTGSLVEVTRPHQWLKNLLLFVPAGAAHRFDGPTIETAMLAFLAFSLCASGGYVLNDLLDMRADRKHHRKRSRPFASGALRPSTGPLLVGLYWSVGFGLAALWLPAAFAGVIALYLASTAAYSLRLKREPVLDVMVLAGLYVIRVVAGGLAVAVPVSTWLLTFTLFVSLSLAFLKRYIEVDRPSEDAVGDPIPARGYFGEDVTWLRTAGITSAYLSTLVLAIYVNSADVARLYAHPERLLVLCPVLLYWATRTWLFAHRRTMHDDPVVAVSLDPATYVVAAASAAVMWAAI